ncbi:hypothetical protein BA895_08980 [Humibacillus sp. DSM 29435]|nr:hypothetical protein BA895_08980 [Humibacillus sp. DSM 29435]
MGPLVVASWPAAVSPLVAAWIDGPPRGRRVLSAFATCLYVELGSHDRVMAVHTPDAVQLPIGVRLSGPVRLNDLVHAGDVVTVGGGRVQLPGADVVGVRRSRPVRVGLGGGTAPSAWRSLGLALPGAGLRDDLDGLDDVATRLCVAALTGRPVQAGVGRLVGAGRGLTPSGDDLLCGILLSLRAFERPPHGAHSALKRAVLSRLHRTTSISAALISAATQGWAAPDIVRLLGLLAGSVPPRPTELCAVWNRAQCIGHTSGADLLAGITATVTALTSLASPMRDTDPLSVRLRQSEAAHA